MPRGDGTGPAGFGPMTGRRLGYCAGYGRPGYMTPGFGWGRGFGRGWGRGFGWRGWWGRYWGYPADYFSPFQYSTRVPTAAEEKEILKEEKEVLTDELEVLKEEMKAIEERLKELEVKKKK